MGKIFEGDVGLLISVDCLEDISTGTDVELLVKKPSGTVVSWAASIVDGLIVYTTQAGDLDEVGIYKIQAKLTLGTWTGCGEQDCFEVSDALEVTV